MGSPFHDEDDEYDSEDEYDDANEELPCEECGEDGGAPPSEDEEDEEETPEDIFARREKELLDRLKRVEEEKNELIRANEARAARRAAAKAPKLPPLIQATQAPPREMTKDELKKEAAREKNNAMREKIHAKTAMNRFTELVRSLVQETANIAQSAPAAPKSKRRREPEVVQTLADMEPDEPAEEQPIQEEYYEAPQPRYAPSQFHSHASHSSAFNVIW